MPERRPVRRKGCLGRKWVLERARKVDLFREMKEGGMMGREGTRLIQVLSWR